MNAARARLPSLNLPVHGGTNTLCARDEVFEKEDLFNLIRKFVVKRRAAFTQVCSDVKSLRETAKLFDVQDERFYRIAYEAAFGQVGDDALYTLNAPTWNDAFFKTCTGVEKDISYIEEYRRYFDTYVNEGFISKFDLSRLHDLSDRDADFLLDRLDSVFFPGTVAHSRTRTGRAPVSRERLLNALLSMLRARKGERFTPTQYIERDDELRALLQADPRTQATVDKIAQLFSVKPYPSFWYKFKEESGQLPTWILLKDWYQNKNETVDLLTLNILQIFLNNGAPIVVQKHHMGGGQLQLFQTVVQKLITAKANDAPFLADQGDETQSMHIFKLLLAPESAGDFKPFKYDIEMERDWVSGEDQLWPDEWNPEIRRTVLVQALMAGCLTIAEMLIEAGAKVHTPRLKALSWDFLDISTAVFFNDYYYNLRNARNANRSRVSFDERALKVLEYLLAFKVPSDDDPSKKDTVLNVRVGRERTMLMVAAMRAGPKIIRWILEQPELRAQLYATDTDDYTVLSHLLAMSDVYRYKYDNLKLLIKEGAIIREEHREKAEYIKDQSVKRELQRMLQES
jgi:hypothetical protein